jgi:hypothetical protein
MKAGTPGSVRQVAVPPAARALSTLSQIDYEDAFVLESGPAQDRTGEQWARAILEDAPIVVRAALVSGWSALGLRLGSPRSDRLVLGWELRRSSPAFALLGASSPAGLSAELLVKRRRKTVLFATMLHLENQIARAVWAAVRPVHLPVVRFVLGATRLDQRGRVSEHDA